MSTDRRERRARRPRAASVALACLVVAVATGCTSPRTGDVDADRPGATGGATPSPSATCVPYTPPRSVADVNDVVTSYRTVPAFRGGDVGASVTLQDGRHLWVFGDTLRAPSFEGTRYVRNSMLVFGEGCAAVVIPADKGAIIPDRADGVGYWPMSIASVRRDGYDLVGVMAQRVRGSDAATEFTNLGPAVAVFRVDRGKLPRLVRQRDLGPDLDDRRRPAWGAAAWVDDDGWLYLYGTSNPEQDMVFGWALQVARMRPEDVVEPSRWTYWDGRRWQSRADRASQLIAAKGGVSQTLSVFRQGAGWYAVSKRDDYLGSELVVWQSASPTGPFRPHAPVASIPSDLSKQVYRYMPLAHPDILSRPGHVLVSVSQNTGDLDLLARNPLLYRPRFLEIPLT